MFTIKKWEEYTYYLFLSLKNGDQEQFRSDFLKLHSGNQIDFFNMLNQSNRQTFYQMIQPDEFAPIFSKLNPSEQKLIEKELDNKYVLRTIECLPADEAVDFLNELSRDLSNYYLDRLEKKDAEKMKALLTYKPETAGAIMTTEYVTALPDETVSEVLARLKIQGKDAETIYYIYVIDHEHRLTGVISLRDIIINDSDRTMEMIMKDQVISVNPYIDQEKVIRIMKDYDLLALPVVSLDHQLMGIITVDDMMDVYSEETNEDFGEMAAVRGAIGLHVSAYSSIKIRLRSLLVLLVLGWIPVAIIDHTPEFLEHIALSAIFIPLITGMAGNAGTQSLAVVLRGLSQGKLNKTSFIKLLKREIMTAFLMALVCGTISMIMGYILTKHTINMGIIVGVSMFLSIFICTLAGTVIPYAAYKFKNNLALISAPFIATISDIIAVIIYVDVTILSFQYL